jgi:dihydropteroate synthase
MVITAEQTQTELVPLKIGQKLFDFSRTYLMGVLNITPDSFSDGGLFYAPDKALSQIEKLIQEGADIIDLGAESSRPGAEPVSAAEEIKRLTPVLKHYKKNFTTPLSLDTTKSEVARFGLEYGVDLINDISAFKGDTHMPQVIAQADVPVILMHMQGRPQNMQLDPQYSDVIQNIRTELKAALQVAQNHHIRNVILDPGIGFGKTLTDNLEILKNLAEFKALNCPLIIGTSRKSFIGKITGQEANNRLAGTIASCVAGVLNGANFIRVHEIGPLKQAMQVTDAIKRSMKKK